MSKEKVMVAQLSWRCLLEDKEDPCAFESQQEHELPEHLKNHHLIPRTKVYVSYREVYLA